MPKGDELTAEHLKKIVTWDEEKGVYRVKSKSEPGKVYEIYPGNYSHDCQGFIFRGSCSHSKAVAAFEEKIQGFKREGSKIHEQRAKVRCPKCDWINEEDTEFINIEEDVYGRDVLTFKCKKCGSQGRSLRVG